MTTGVKMQAAALLKSTLRAQYDTLKWICNTGKTVLFHDFKTGFDKTVKTLLSSIAGLVGRKVVNEAVKRAQEHDTSRWSEDEEWAMEPGHIRSKAEKEELVELWTRHPSEMDPEWNQVSEERERFFHLLDSCQ